MKQNRKRVARKLNKEVSSLWFEEFWRTVANAPPTG